MPHTGTPRRKLAVPSIGSMIHWRTVSPWAPNSSPKMPSSGRSVASASRIARSTARSASVTCDASAFSETRRSAASKRGRDCASAASASRSARARSAREVPVRGHAGSGRQGGGGHVSQDTWACGPRLAADVTVMVMLTLVRLGRIHAPLAQSAEQLTLNQWVQGSSPWGCTDRAPASAKRGRRGPFVVVAHRRGSRGRIEQ